MSEEAEVPLIDIRPYVLYRPTGQIIEVGQHTLEGANAQAAYRAARDGGEVSVLFGVSATLQHTVNTETDPPSIVNPA